MSAPLYNFSIRDCVALAEQTVAKPGWQGVQWESIEGAAGLVTGHVYEDLGVFKRGPRKGRPKKRKVPGTERRVVVTYEQINAAAAEFERTTGRCFECKGEGQVLAGWSNDEGIKHRKCRRCNGTGEATGEQS